MDTTRIGSTGLSAQTNLFSRLAELFNCGVYAKVAKEDGEIIAWNTRMVEIFGIQASEAEGANEQALFDAELANTFQQVERNIWYLGDVVEGEYTYPTASGFQLLKTRHVPLWSPEGQPWVVVVTVDPISLSVEQSQYLSHLSADPMLSFCFMDADGGMQFWSEAFRSLLVEEHVEPDTPIQSLLPAKVMQQIHHHMDMVSAASPSVSFPVSWPIAEDERWCECFLKGHYEQGVLQTWSLRVRDAKDEYIAAMNAWQSWAMFRAIYDDVADAVLLLDEEGRISKGNPAAAELFGTEAEQLSGGDFQDFLDSAHQARFSRMLEKVGTQEDSPVEIWQEVGLYNAQGQIVHVRLTLNTVNIDNAQLILLTAMDLTAQKEAQESLRTLAFVDTPTGQLNRNGLFDHLNNLDLEQSNPGMVMIELLDLDSLSVVTGSDFTDALSKAVCLELSKLIFEGDRIAKIDHRLYAIVFSQAGRAGLLMEGIRKILKTHIEVEGIDVELRGRLSQIILTHGQLFDALWLDNLIGDVSLKPLSSELLTLSLDLRDYLSSTNQVVKLCVCKNSVKRGRKALEMALPEFLEVDDTESLVSTAFQSGMATALTLSLLKNSMEEAVSDSRRFPLAVPMSLGSLRSESFATALTREINRFSLPSSRIILMVNLQGVTDVEPDILKQLDILRASGFSIGCFGLQSDSFSLTALQSISPDWVLLKKDTLANEHDALLREVLRSAASRWQARVIEPMEDA